MFDQVNAPLQSSLANTGLSGCQSLNGLQTNHERQPDDVSLTYETSEATKHERQKCVGRSLGENGEEESKKRQLIGIEENACEEKNRKCGDGKGGEGALSQFSEENKISTADEAV